MGATDKVSGARVGRLIATVAITMFFVGSLTHVALYSTQGRNPLIPQAGERTSAYVTVDNTVVFTATELIEADSPLYLSTRPEPFCVKNGCKVEGSNTKSGQVIKVACFTFGTGMTNMNLWVIEARINPHRVSSNLWYGVRMSEGARLEGGPPITAGTIAYYPEVFLTGKSRGGLDLPACKR